MKKKVIIGLSIAVVLIAVSAYFYFNKTTKGHHKGASKAGQSSSLLAVRNLEDFYITDKSDDLGILSSHKFDGKKVKSVKLYRYSDVYDTMFFVRELFFDFNGKVVKSAYHSHESNEVGYTYYFYNDKAKNYLEV